MTRDEALRILGLDADATPEEIKAAYKESAQILHPDRFASNKKLQDRATEQFKTLQEAYDVLMDPTKATRSRRRPQAEPERPVSDYVTAREIEARLAGIAAARTQLVAERDAMLDKRKSGMVILGIGLVLAVVFRRFPFAIALGSTAIVWGLVQTFSCLSTINALNQNLSKLDKEKRALLERLDSL